MSSFTVGVTGGIGSGKSAVTERFAALGITVVDADLASRAVVEPGTPALAAIAERYGAAMLDGDGRLDRPALRKVVFEDPAERAWLERLTHPLIHRWIGDRLAEATSAYAMLAHPLLVETGQTDLCQRVLVVDVPEALQIERVMARDDNPESQVRAIIAAQATREQRLAQADDVIVNDRGLDALDAAVAELHRKYLALAKALAQ